MSACSVVIDFFSPETASQKIQSSSNTIGKCSSKGCMRPMVCTHGGTIKPFSNTSKNTSRQFNVKLVLYKMVFQRCIFFYFFPVLSIHCQPLFKVAFLLNSCCYTTGDNLYGYTLPEFHWATYRFSSSSTHTSCG